MTIINTSDYADHNTGKFSPYNRIDQQLMLVVLFQPFVSSQLMTLLASSRLYCTIRILLFLPCAAAATDDDPGSANDNNDDGSVILLQGGPAKVRLTYIFDGNI